MKKVFIIVFVFLILYLEPLSFGGVKFAHIWKIVFILFTIPIILRHKVQAVIFVKIYLLYAVSLIISPYLFDHFFITILDSSKYLIFVILFYLLRIKNGYSWLNKSFVSKFIILSFVPFYLDLLPQLGSAYKLEEIGFALNDGLSGLFQQQHEASLILSLSTITLLFELIYNKSKNKIIYAVLVGLGLFFLIKTYVRLGLLLFVVGCIVALFYRTRLKVKILASIGVLLSSIFLVVIFNSVNNEFTNVYKARFLGQTGYSKSSNVDINTVSSGRLFIWGNSISNIYEEDNLAVLFLGLTQSELIERNRKQINMAVFAHNEFVNALAAGGLLSLFLICLFFVKWFILIRKSKLFVKTNNYRYSIIIFVCVIIYSFLQGGPFSFLLSLFICFSLEILLKKETKGNIINSK